ncbi:MAG TPA: Lrp/AsnC family transcriptional regulator [Acidilobales archaeon]|nr:Lrp/AsnC family transcriptional regulator [Acidilobales archaeon]
MPSAFVLINTELGSEDEVFEELTKIPGVEEAYIVYGAYDIIVLVKAESLNELRSIVINKIRRIPKVRSTTTMVIVERK